MNKTFDISSCCHTDTGLVRSHNEDTCFVNNENGCFLVADGMGGAAAGEVASSLMKETVQDLFSDRTTCTSGNTQKLIVDCFQTANNRILNHVAVVPSHTGMGCTAELLFLCDNSFCLGHVGDSRTYRLRNGNLKQLTKDHSLVQTQEDLGVITRNEAKNHSLRNVILRAVGSKKDLEVDIIRGFVQSHDIFLLCTDGLFGMVDDEKIKEILAFKGPLTLKATMLIDQANYEGGKDNVSVVLIEIQ